MSGPGGVLVVGGGQLGAAIARQAARQGDRVVVASRTPRPHPGLWRRFDLDVDNAAALVSDGPVRAWICVRGPATDRLGRLAADLDRAGATVTLCAPLGAVVGSRATLLTVGPLFGPEDACLAPLLPALRAGGVARHPRGLPASRPLYVEDAARACLRLGGAGGAHRLVGRDRVEMAQLADLLGRRFGGRCRPRWLGSLPAADVDQLRLSADDPGDWDDARLGARLPVAEWIERLPGPRPRR